LTRRGDAPEVAAATVPAVIAARAAAKASRFRIPTPVGSRIVPRGGAEFKLGPGRDGSLLKLSSLSVVRRPESRAEAVRLFLLVCLGIAVVATVGGVLFAEIRGGTTVSRAVAYAFWFAAALVLAAMVLSGSRTLARRGLPQVEGWVFVTAAFLLTGVGVLVDGFG